MMRKLRVNRMQRLTGMHLSLVISGTCSPRLVDFAIRLVNSVVNLPDGQVLAFGEIQITQVL